MADIELGPHKVLVADDEVGGFVEILTAKLNEMGCEVLTAFDGEEALKIARKEHPALIVASETLTRINGFKLCRFLKFDRKRRDMSVIVVTGEPSEDGQEIAEQVRASAYLTKPVDELALGEALERALKRAK